MRGIEWVRSFEFQKYLKVKKINYSRLFLNNFEGASSVDYSAIIIVKTINSKTYLNTYTRSDIVLFIKWFE